MKGFSGSWWTWLLLAPQQDGKAETCPSMQGVGEA